MRNQETKAEPKRERDEIEGTNDETRYFPFCGMQEPFAESAKLEKGNSQKSDFVVGMVEISAGEPREGNWYVLLAGLPRPTMPLALAPGVSLRPLEDKLTIFDLAAAGASGLQGWTAIEPFCPHCTAELESAKDANVAPGYDTLNRAWLVTALLILRGFTKLWGVSCSAYSWTTIAGHQKRTAEVFHEQARKDGIEKAVHESKRALPRFTGNLLDYHFSILVDSHVRDDSPNEADARWITEHFEDFNRIASGSSSFRFALEAAVDWRFAKDSRAAVARLWVKWRQFLESVRS